MQLEFDGNSFGFSNILNSFFKYKWINLLIILCSLMLGLLYYSLKQPTYQSTTTIEVSTNPKDNRLDFFDQKDNQVARAIGTATEIDILKSEFLLGETLKKINMDVDYFEEIKFKKRVLYKNSPFSITRLDVKSDNIYGKIFIVKHVDKNRYELFLKKSFFSDYLALLPTFLKPKEKISLKRAIYNYGDLVKLPTVSFVVEKSGKYKRAVYSFSVSSPEAVILKLKKSLSVKTASMKSSVLKITYKDNVAKRAKDFLNLFVQNYLHYSKKDMIEIDNKTLDFINKQLGAVSGKLENSENLLQVYKKSNNISDIDIQKRETVVKLNDFQVELKNAQIELHVIKKLYKAVKDGKYNIIASISKNYPVLDTMLGNLEKAKLDKEKQLTLFTQNHPDVISITNSIYDTQYAILQTSKGIYKRAQERFSSLEKVVQDYTEQLRELPEIEKELVKHKRHFTVNDKIYNYLLKKQSELSIEKASTTLNKKVLDYARESKKPISPKLSLILPLYLFIGLVFALLHSILRDKYDTKIKDRYDVNRLTDIPIFGSIPFVKNSKSYNGAYVLDEPNSGASEAIRAIKNNLEYTPTEKNCKVILVTSTVPNEGKTTISANLAAMLGMGEKTCIILSLDLRRPELHHKFLLSNKKGMSDVLSGKMDIKDITWENEKFNNLNIVTSGAVPPNPAELIASSKMTEVIQDLSLQYDYIVLDTPPFEYVNDSMSLLKLVDVTLFVVKSEFSEKKYVKDIDKLVKRVGVDNPGIILNSVKKRYQQRRKFDYRYIYHEA